MRLTGAQLAEFKNQVERAGPVDFGSNTFVVNMALNMLGLSDADKATVTAALPNLQAIVDLVNNNIDTVNKAVALANQIMPYAQKCMPAAQIVADKLGQG